MLPAHCMIDYSVQRFSTVFKSYDLVNAEGKFNQSHDSLHAHTAAGLNSSLWGREQSWFGEVY